MQKFKINELKSHPRNNEFFDDMSGEKWQEFLESIKTSGVIEPIVVTQDKVIVSGHQRVRACKELGIEGILAEVKVYDNEDDIIKDLLETNIRQRGDIGGSTVKLGRRIKELERIYGVRQGSANPKGTKVSSSSSNGTSPTQQDLASKLGIDMNTLKRAKTIANLPQEIQDLVEQGNITPSTASRVISKLSDEEQAELIEGLPATKKLTQKEVEGYIEKLQEKDNQIAGYEKKLSKAISNNENFNNEQIKLLNKQLEEVKKEKDNLQKQLDVAEAESTNYKKLKKEVESLTKQKTKLSRQIDCATELSRLVEEIKDMLEVKLAPIKFKKCIDVIATDNNDVAVKNVLEILEKVDIWSDEIHQIIERPRVLDVKATIVDDDNIEI